MGYPAKGGRHPPAQGSFKYYGEPTEVDRQVEVARRYYESGGIEAERVRVRERATRPRLELPSGTPGFWKLFGQLTVLGWLAFVAGSAPVVFLSDPPWWSPFASIAAVALWLTIVDKS